MGVLGLEFRFGSILVAIARTRNIGRARIVLMFEEDSAASRSLFANDEMPDMTLSDCRAALPIAQGRRRGSFGKKGRLR